MSRIKEKQRLLQETIKLRKAWLIMQACMGQLDQEDFFVPDYENWPKTLLRGNLAALQDDVVELLRCVAKIRSKRALGDAANWMAGQFDRWIEADGLYLTLCTAQYFEDRFGKLRNLGELDIPPYAELRVQGLYGLAFRHPEYMLARDLEFTYSCYTDGIGLADSLEADSTSPEVFAAANENCQALARSVILTCFNLLDAFVSGLARGYVIRNRNLETKLRQKLLDNRRALKSRIILIPNLIAGCDCGLDVNKPPVAPLFGPIRNRRDAFVHCEPGRQETSTGYIKEAAFHDVARNVVDQAVELTSEIICHHWNFLYGRPRPTWWKMCQTDGMRPNLRLVPPISK